MLVQPRRIVVEVSDHADIIIFLNNMATEVDSPFSQSKKASFQIAKFHYHLSNTVPELFPEIGTPKATQTPRFLRWKKSHRNMVYHYAAHSAEGVSSLDAQSIVQSAKKLYISSDCVRMSDSSFRKSVTHKVPYLPIYGHFHEVVEFQIMDKTEGREVKSIRNTRIRAKQAEDETTKQLQTLIPINNFELYVIHHCQPLQKEGQESMRWESFIEKYHFLEENNGGQAKHKIVYSLIFSHEQEEESMLGFFASTQKLYDCFLSEYLTEDEAGLQNLSKMQGYLMLAKDRVDRKLKDLRDPSFQESHKRWLKLPSEYYKQFLTLKKHTTSYYNSIHDQPKHPEHVVNNLICRYMHAKEYKYKESLQSIMEYLKWEKELADKFNLSMFAHLHNLDFFTYLGKDFQGRPVVLNRASHLKVDAIKDIEEYCNYYIYYLQVWMQKQWRGYADQYTIIADVQGLGTDNFKLEITKRNMGDCLRYCPERQYKFIAVNIGTFARIVWGVLKPLLPKRTVEKLCIAGSDKAEILEILSKEMDITVIPEYLGGKNTRTYRMDLQETLEELKPVQQN